VIDPNNLVSKGRFYTHQTVLASAFAIDPLAGRAYFSAREGYGYSFSSFDLKTYQLTGFYSAENPGVPAGQKIGDTPAPMVVAGNIGLAVVAHGQGDYVIIFPFRLLKPPVYNRPKPAPQNGSIRAIPLPNNGVVYNPVDGMLYATTPGSAGAIGNSVVPVNPVTGTVEDPAWVGSDPWQTAVSDDGSYLYVSLYNEYAIRRLQLPSLSSDLFFRIYSDDGQSVRATQMLPIPGSPRSIVAVRLDDPAALTYGSYGVVVYDDAVRRPDSTGHADRLAGRIDVIQSSASGNTVYGTDNESTAFSFAKLSLGPRGVDPILLVEPGYSGFSVDMKCQNDQCFFTTGVVFDPSTMAMTGRIQFDQSDLFSATYTPTAVLPDLERGLVYYLRSDIYGTIYVLAYNAASLQQVGSLQVPGVRGIGTNLVMWGSDQLAFSTGDQIVLVPLSALK